MRAFVTIGETEYEVTFTVEGPDWSVGLGPSIEDVEFFNKDGQDCTEAVEAILGTDTGNKAWREVFEQLWSHAESSYEE